jgi:hypothetical protein
MTIDNTIQNNFREIIDFSIKHNYKPEKAVLIYSNLINIYNKYESNLAYTYAKRDVLALIKDIYKINKGV